MKITSKRTGLLALAVTLAPASTRRSSPVEAAAM
jgi:hypothetical protein